jgi:type VI secretion system protein ImpA
MGSPSVLDIESLLADIPGENPAGVDLREDYSPKSVFRVLKDARAAARAAERNVVWEDEESAGAKADWSPVLKLAPQALATQSKDLEVTAWLIEALLRTHGFAGLRDGLRLACGLVERYWEQIYPLPDAEGLETRLAPLTGLNGVEGDGVLIPAICNVPITAGASAGPFHLGHYRQALDLERIEDPEKRAARIENGAVSLQLLQKVVAETPAEFFQTLRADLSECSDEFEKLVAVLEGTCGADSSGHSLAPPSSNIRNALQACREVIDFLAPPSVPVPVGGADSAGRPAEASGGGVGKLGEHVRNREDAFRALLQVAEFFKRTEPHSPVSYALEQAVRWGRMTLPDLLGELVQEQSMREQIFKLIGIPMEHGPE